ncbi:hypothetical protein HN011_003174 [Eciton burchellii]|nr:hypothetical protein HN011_003174 [Eciton burchellii]
MSWKNRTEGYRNSPLIATTIRLNQAQSQQAWKAEKQDIAGFHWRVNMRSFTEILGAIENSHYVTIRSSSRASFKAAPNATFVAAAAAAVSRHASIPENRDQNKRTTARKLQAETPRGTPRTRQVDEETHGATTRTTTTACRSYLADEATMD